MKAKEMKQKNVIVKNKDTSKYQHDNITSLSQLQQGRPENQINDKEQRLLTTIVNGEENHKSKTIKENNESKDNTT